jgi:protein associated with RNAse G/E
MKNLKSALLFAFIMTLISCNNKVKNENSEQNCDEVNKEVMGMTVVVCADGNYYYTSQGFLGGCGKSEVEFLIYDVDVKIGQVFNDDNNDSDGKYIDVDFSKIDIEANLELEKQMLAGKYCTCGDHKVKCMKSDCDCTTICEKAEKILKQIDYGNQPWN